MAVEDGAGRLVELAEQFKSAAAAVKGRDDWDELRRCWLGRKQGLLKTLMGRMKEIPAAERRAYGQGVNRLKAAVEAELAELDGKLTEAERVAVKRAAELDVTLPGRRPRTGVLHPVT
ncbi:MAG: phenylalanine--tRNA ligase subunit alpha, partial [bacterium]|nr:phenylalanine--tRNA ligase subunit alpha [bacterium]